MTKLLQNTLKFKLFDNYPIVAGFSTKHGGVSTGYYESMNLGFVTGDSKVNVLENYKKFAKDLSVDFDKMVLSCQKHLDHILIAEAEHAGMGLIHERTYDDIDGIYTEVKNLPIVTGHADCTPIFFYDKQRQAIGLVHSGWRGTAQEIAKKMIDLFVSKGSNVEDILCVIAPAICYDCYEVGDEVVNAMPSYCNLDAMKKTFNDLAHQQYNKPHIDLKEINRQILLHSGILKENIEVSEYCTKCDKDLFFSHRLLGSKRGAHAALMCLV